MPYICSFLKRYTMPAALTLTHVLFGVFGVRMFCEACLSIASARGPQGARGTARTGNTLFAFPLRRLVPMFLSGAALTRKTRFSMRHSRVIKRKDKSSAAEGEALPGYRKQQRILN
jgi:hypothetical protein